MGEDLARTAVDLYRLGNATNARLNCVRLSDIQHYNYNGVIWVQSGTGGVSTFSQPTRTRGRWWKLDAGYDYHNLLLVWNDHANHWSWEPVKDVSLSDYVSFLTLANVGFRQV